MSNLRWTDADERLLLELAASKMQLRDIAKTLHRSRDSVRSHLIRLRVRTYTKGRLGRPPKATWNPDELERAIEMRKQGMEFKDIAEQLGRPELAVYRKLRYVMSPPTQQQAIRERERLSSAEHRERSQESYTPEEDDIIRAAWRDHEDVNAIAAKVGHSVKSVYTRASKLGLRRAKQEGRITDGWAYSRDQLIGMNERFCRAMRHAIHLGLEVAPTEVSTVPCTGAPRRKEMDPYMPIGRGVAGECADA